MRGDIGRGGGAGGGYNFFLFFCVFFSSGYHTGLSRVLELIKIHLHIRHAAHWRTAKKNRVVVTADWVRRRTYTCPKKHAGVGCVGVRIWVHDKIL